MVAVVQPVLARQRSLETARNPWNQQFQMQGEYINLKRTNFSSTNLTPEFLNGQLFDTTATEAHEVAASAMLGWLWDNGPSSFTMEPAEAFKGDDQAKEWFEYCTNQMRQLMGDDKSGLSTALGEVMEDALSPGTGFLAVLDDSDDVNNPLLYESWALDECYIWEGKAGKVIGLHRKRRLEISVYVDEYKIENCPQWVVEAYNNNRQQETAEVLTAIYKRPDDQRDPKKKGAKNMPFASMHIDLKSQKVVKESGFSEFPIMAVRLQKKGNETYGRGYGFKVLPLALELNALWEAITLAWEKKLDPALVVLDNGTMGGGTVDTSPGAINTVRVTGRAGSMDSPIKPIFDVGDPSGALELIQDLREQVYSMGKLDRMLNTNDDKEMTLGEAQMRDSRSNMAMTNPITRATAELFTPMIDRTFAICLRRNKFGYVKGTVEAKVAEANGEKMIWIPDSIVQAANKGIQAYTVRYLTPAARLVAAAEAQGIRATIQDAGNMSALFPGIQHRIDQDFALSRLCSINGAPAALLLSDDDVKARADAANAQQADANTVAAAPQLASAALSAAKAGQTVQATQAAANGAPGQ